MTPSAVFPSATENKKKTCAFIYEVEFARPYQPSHESNDPREVCSGVRFDRATDLISTYAYDFQPKETPTMI